MRLYAYLSFILCGLRKLLNIIFNHLKPNVIYILTTNILSIVVACFISISPWPALHIVYSFLIGGVLILVNMVLILADTEAKTVCHAPCGTNGTILVNHNGAKSPEKRFSFRQPLPSRRVPQQRYTRLPSLSSTGQSRCPAYYSSFSFTYNARRHLPHGRDQEGHTDHFTFPQTMERWSWSWPPPRRRRWERTGKRWSWLEIS